MSQGIKEDDNYKLYVIEAEEEKKAEFDFQNYPYHRFQLWAGCSYNFSSTELDKVNENFKLFSIEGSSQHINYLEPFGGSSQHICCLDSVADGSQYINYLDNNTKEKEPVKYSNLRFQLCSVKVSIHKFSARNETFFQKFVVYGHIMVSDQSVSRDDGWVPLNLPMYRFTSVFHRQFYEPVPITNTSYLHYLTSPSSHRSACLSTFLDVVFQLYAFDKDARKEVFCVADERMVLDISDTDSLDSPMSHVFQGPDGCAEFSYILFTDAVDASLEITFKKTDSKSVVFAKPVSVKIVAYYGDEIDLKGQEKSDYYMTLFLDGSVTLFENMKLQLNNSVFAVNKNGSLIIKAFINDSSGKVLMNDTWTFDAKNKGSSRGSIKGTKCSLDLKVKWKY